MGFLVGVPTAPMTKRFSAAEPILVVQPRLGNHLASAPMSAPFSIVTAARNRTAQLRSTAASISRFGTHSEHLIVDWSSNPPITVDDLPTDPRVRLVRVEGERFWWLSRAYNRGFREAAHPWILKADADALLEEPFFNGFDASAATLQLRHLPGGLAGQGNLNDLTRLATAGAKQKKGGSMGLFAVEVAALRSVGGFNPWLVGWGFDDIDLYESLFLLPGTTISHLSGEGSLSLPHGVAQRLGAPESDSESLGPWRLLGHSLQLQSQLEANRTMAALSRAGQLPAIAEPMGQEPADLLQRLPSPLRELRRRALLAGWCRPLIGRHALSLARSMPTPWLPKLLRVLGIPELSKG